MALGALIDARLRLTDAQRRRLAATGHRIGDKP
jgi:hypothetical protein